MDVKEIAKQAIYEGMSLLGNLAQSDPRWLQESVPLGKLNSLAVKLSYRDANEIVDEINMDGEAESEMFRGVYDCPEW